MQKKLISQEVWDEIAKADIIVFAQQNGFGVIKQGKRWVLEGHDSCVFFNRNSFYRFSDNKGGNLYQFIKEFITDNNKEALTKAMEFVNAKEYEPIIKKVKEYQPQSTHSSKSLFQLPPKALNNRKAIAYLCQERKIPYPLVLSYLKKGYLYQDKQDFCVFVGKFKNNPYFATRRSINPPKRRFDVSGSFKEVGVYTPGEENNKSLIVTEAVIDQMSFKAIFDPQEKNNYLSVNGVASTEKCVHFWLSHQEGKIDTVYFALDADEAGIRATQEGMKYVKENHPGVAVKWMKPDKGAKDWNELLVTETKERELAMTKSVAEPASIQETTDTKIVKKPQEGR